MPGSDGQDLLALQKAIHSSNLQSSRQKDWHPEKMTEIQTHVSDIFCSVQPLTVVSWRAFSAVDRKIVFPIILHSLLSHVATILHNCLRSKRHETGRRTVYYNLYSTYHLLEGPHKPSSFPLPKPWVRGNTNRTIGVAKITYKSRMEAIIVPVSTFEAAKALVMFLR